MRASGKIRAQDTVRSLSYGLATRHQSTERVLPKGANGIRVADLYAYKPTVYRSRIQYKGAITERHCAVCVDQALHRMLWSGIAPHTLIRHCVVWACDGAMRCAYYALRKCPRSLGRYRYRIQVQCRLGSNGFPDFRIACAMATSLRMRATMMTLGGLPAALSRCTNEANALQRL